MPEEITNLGFSITNTIKLLGFSITNGENSLDGNFEPIKQKISSITRFWDRFYLSLPGKITVYNTLLLPQLNYIGTILMPDERTLTELTEIMENFVTWGFSIAKKRLYAKPEDGGLGLFDFNQHG